MFVCCFTFQQHASVSERQICSDNCTCCHTEIEAADQTTSPSHSIQTPDLAGSPLECQFFFLSHWYDTTRKDPTVQAGIELRIFRQTDQHSQSATNRPTLPVSNQQTNTPSQQPTDQHSKSATNRPTLPVSNQQTNTPSL